MTAPKRYPIRYVIFTGPKRGTVVSTEWHGFATDIWDHVEAHGARMAREWGAEIDIEIGSVMPSGKVAGWERAGMRCMAA